MRPDDGRTLSRGGPEIVPEARPLVSCFWCERLHPGKHPLSVCPACAARYSILRSLEMSGSHPLRRVENAENTHTQFAFSYARSAEEAYAKESRNYDAFDASRLDNAAERSVTVDPR